MADLAAGLGAAIPSLLGRDGVGTSLADAVNQVADQVLDGADPAGALQSALTALQSNPAFTDAASATIRGAVPAILGIPGVRQVVSDSARLAVIGLLDQAGINLGVLNVAAGEVTRATLNSLLAAPAVWALISDVASDVVIGIPPNQLANNVIHAVVGDTDLQIAIGLALGQGVGSLFGDTAFGRAVGYVAGAAATLQIVLAAGIVGLFMGDTPTFYPVGPRPPAAVHGGVFATPAAGQLFAAKAHLHDWHDLGALRESLTAGANFSLTDIRATLGDTGARGAPQSGPENFLDIVMSVADGRARLGRSVAPPLMVAFRLDFDRIFPPILPVPITEARPVQKVAVA